jgi:adenylosuccinate lyase
MADQETSRRERDTSVLSLPKRLQLGFETYLSVFSYRYGSEKVRGIWSQNHYWSLFRKVEIANAESLMEAGVVSKEQVEDLKSASDDLFVERIFQWERDRQHGTGHDATAGVKEFAEVAPVGGAILGHGLTSEDRFSNVEEIQIKESFEVIDERLIEVLKAFAPLIDKYKERVCVAYTHLQAAEPTTVGYRFAKYAQDFTMDLEFLRYINSVIKGKGIKGAVGTQAAHEAILENTGLTPQEHEQRVMEKLGLEATMITDQTSPRKYLLFTAMALTSIAQSAHRLGLDMQILQSTAFDEVSEPVRKGIKGSSAMPHKKNPINWENVCSLSEEVVKNIFSAWQNSAYVTLERTLRDSAGKRSWLPEGFLAVDEILTRVARLVENMQVHDVVIANNFKKVAPYMATEILLARLTEAGMNRQEAHSVLVEDAEEAVRIVREGRKNPLRRIVLEDQRIVSVLGEKGVKKAFRDIYHHVGNAPQMCTDFLEQKLKPLLEAA